MYMSHDNHVTSILARLTEKWKSHSMANESANGMKFINSLAELLKRLLDYRYTAFLHVHVFIVVHIGRFILVMSTGT